MKKTHQKNGGIERSSQEMPAEIIDDLLLTIRNQLCAEMTPKEWYQNQRFFKRVLTYPAAWLNKRGVTLPPARYQQICRDLLRDIKTHAGPAVKHWPGYLLHSFQQHFKHHGEDYYNEGKSIRAATERALLAFTRVQEAPKPPDPVPSMAAAHAILSPKKTRARTPAKPPQQPDLFPR
jgi:predicted SprT family Zn-dependent metalloprotease